MKRKIILLIIFFIITFILFFVYNLYNIVFKPNIDLGNQESVIIHIPTNSNFEDVCDILLKKAGLISEKNFKLLAKKKNYVNRIKSGRFKINNGISNNKLINKLRAGIQEPLNLTFNNIRKKEDLAEVVASKLEFSKTDLLRLLNNDSISKLYGFNLDEFPIMFIPNTYEIYWNITPEEFIAKMNNEYKRFWNEERINKANAINLTPIEVSILASIVMSETNKRDEMATVAGVYINRLNRDMKLEADPTVRYAVGDFSIQRILYKHLEFVSPYNTYIYTGLPPGPIYFPDVFAIDAVLNYEKHDYIFLCAKDDFSGYHVFAKSNAEHSRNSRRYHDALNKNKIR
jgi:UPF0755 protein